MLWCLYCCWVWRLAATEETWPVLKVQRLPLLAHYEAFVHIIIIIKTTTKSASTPVRINETQPFLIGLAAACATYDIINLNDSCVFDWLCVSLFDGKLLVRLHISAKLKTDCFLSFKRVKSVAMNWVDGEHQLTFNPPTHWRTYDASSFLYHCWSLKVHSFSASTQTHPLSDVSEWTGPADWTLHRHHLVARWTAFWAVSPEQLGM